MLLQGRFHSFRVVDVSFEVFEGSQVNLVSIFVFKDEVVVAGFRSRFCAFFAGPGISLLECVVLNNVEPLPPLVDRDRVGADGAVALKCSLLLPLLALLVLFLVLRRGLTVVVRVVDLLSELDAELALLDPRGLWLEGHP